MTKQKTEENPLSQQEVFDVLQFANQIYNNGFLGVYTPSMSNQNLISLNNNPLIPTRDSIEKSLKAYKESANILQSYSEFAEVFDKIYSRTLEYYANMLSFDLDIVCKNAYAPEKDYKSKEYKDDLNRVYKFLDNFDYKGEFLRVTKQMLRNETYFTWFRDSQGTFDDTGEIELDENGDVKTKKMSNYTLQIMPQERCLLTGMWEKGLLFDFDMNYFLKAGVDINSYDPVFKKYWRDVFGGEVEQKYNPTAPLDNRNGSFALWTQTSPQNGSWCFKFDMSNMNAVPFLSSMIRNVLTNQEMEALQRDINFITAKGILAGEIPLMDKQKSGEVTDAMAYKLTTLSKFMQAVKMGLEKNISAVAMPTKDVDFYQYENKNPDMYSKQLETSSGVGASASRLIYSSGKMSESEIQNAILTDYNLMKRVYTQFNNFMDFYVNKKTRKYKFNFIFSGCNYNFVREAEKKNLLDLAQVGVVLNSSAYSKIVGMKPHDFDRALSEGHYGDMTDKLSMLLSIHTQSGNVGQGAPKKSETEISDSGSDARDAGS